jgi:hypothetical protein
MARASPSGVRVPMTQNGHSISGGSLLKVQTSPDPVQWVVQQVGE